MPSVGRNESCPCGSGKKFKKCCINKTAPEDALPLGSRIVERNGQHMIASKGVSQLDIDLAAEHFEAKSKGKGMAQQIADFSKPLVDEAEGDIKRIETAFYLGTILWNISMCKDQDEQEEMIVDLIHQSDPTGEDERPFRALVLQMIDRHKTMYPELHR